MPDGKHRDLLFARHVVDVIASLLQEEPTRSRHRRLPIGTTDLRGMTEDVERRGQLVDEDVLGGSSVFAPPIVDRADL